MENNKTTVTILGVGVNRHFNYARYFSMVPVGPEGVKAFSKGFFELAAAQQPKPQTVAMLSADAEFAKTSADGARENAAANGFKIVYDKSYPPPTTDFGPPCAPSRRPTPISFSLPPIRRTVSASCAPRMRSG
jgi:branched-chain amino acid transport system substrate-binding protein